MKMEQNGEKNKKGWITTTQPLPLHPCPYLYTSNRTSAPLPSSVYLKAYLRTPALICVLQTLPLHPAHLYNQTPTSVPLLLRTYPNPYPYLCTLTPTSAAPTSASQPLHVHPYSCALTPTSASQPLPLHLNPYTCTPTHVP